MSNRFFYIISIIITMLGLSSLLVLFANIYFKKFSTLVDRIVNLEEHLQKKEKDDFLKEAAHRFNFLKFPLMVKRFLDIIGSASLLILMLPIFVLLSLGIRIDSPGPIFIKRRAIGQNGKIFFQYAFRTEYLPRNQEADTLTIFPGWTPDEEATNRTRFGKFLYHSSLDLLPALINVLVGDMSIIGRRSFREDHLTDDLLSPEEKAILLRFKPGIASLWDISRDRVYDDKKRMGKLDLAYALHWSLWLDLMILSRTIPTALARGSEF